VLVTIQILVTTQNVRRMNTEPRDTYVDRAGVCIGTFRVGAAQHQEFIRSLRCSLYFFRRDGLRLVNTLMWLRHTTDNSQRSNQEHTHPCQAVTHRYLQCAVARATTPSLCGT